MIVSQQPPALGYDGPPSLADQFVDVENFTYADVARLKLVTKQTVMEWVKRGMIPSPIYTGYTARFTRAQVTQIMTEMGAPGTYPVTPSPRAEIGKLGGPKALRPRYRNGKKRKQPLPKPWKKTTKEQSPKTKPKRKK